MKKRKQQKASPRKGALEKPLSRAVPPVTRLFLYTQAGGRCEFDDCNHYLLEHHVTARPGIFAEMAHIWAFSDDGPRGSEEGRDATAVHDLSNLMLLCPGCHKLIDDNEHLYGVDVLRGFKKAHEDRVFMLTGTKPERKTLALTVRARIAGQPVVIPNTAVQEAVAPRYVNPREIVDIDLTAFDDGDSDAYWRLACETISKRLNGVEVQRKESFVHLSVLALAPMPLLIYLGRCLSNKVPTQFFQRHRDTGAWRWKESGGPVVAYETKALRQGSDPARVALLLSLSGRVEQRELPAAVDGTYSIYEITLRDREPEPRFLDLEESLHAFRREYMATLRRIVAQHDGLTHIDLFPAVPAPVAACVGHDLLPKRDPALSVWDYDRRATPPAWLKSSVVVNP